MIFYPKTEQEVNIFVNNEKRVGEVLGITWRRFEKKDGNRRGKNILEYV